MQRLRPVTFFDIAVAALQAKAIEFDFEEKNSFFDVVQAAMEKDDQEEEEQEQDKEEQKAIADQMKELEVLTKRQAVLSSHSEKQEQHATELTDKHNQPISEASRPFANLSSCERGENDHYEEYVVAASAIPHEHSIAPVMIREESVAFFASMSSCERGENENEFQFDELNQNDVNQPTHSLT